MFVGTVGEEGLGNLRGVKALLQQNKTIDGFITIEPGAGGDRIGVGATGSRRWRVTFKGPADTARRTSASPAPFTPWDEPSRTSRICSLQCSHEPRSRSASVGRHLGQHHRLASGRGSGYPFRRRRQRSPRSRNKCSPRWIAVCRKKICAGTVSRSRPTRARGRSSGGNDGCRLAARQRCSAGPMKFCSGPIRI